MEKDSKALPYAAIRRAKAHSRGTLARAMEKPFAHPKPAHHPRKSSPSLEVHVMFEPSRLAQQCLQDAYACLIPLVRRRVGPMPSHTHSPNAPAQPGGERSVQ